MKLKVLSYNVHKLFNLMGTEFFLPALKETLTGMDLDMVFLQELPGLAPEEYQAQYSSEPLEHLADELWDHYIYGKNAISSNGHHGNAILSKFPFLSSENFDISNHFLERRGLLTGVVNINDIFVQVGCTHLDLTMLGRRRQANKIRKIVETKIKPQAPFLLCGDFNDWTGSTSLQMSKIGLQGAVDVLRYRESTTFPSFYPVLSLDKIFYRNLHCSYVRVLTDPYWKKFSDHLPLYSEFEFSSE